MKNFVEKSRKVFANMKAEYKRRRKIKMLEDCTTYIHYEVSEEDIKHLENLLEEYRVKHNIKKVEEKQGEIWIYKS